MLDNHRFLGAACHSSALAIVISAAALILGCSSDIAQRGNLPTAEKIAEVRPGSTTREDVVKILGTPSSTGVFNDKNWYYISRRTKQISFFSPEVLDQQVYIVAFDDKGVVKMVDHKDLGDGQDITPAPGATPSPGRELSFLEQLLGNVGKFNGASDSTGGRGVSSSTESPAYTAH